MRPLARNRAAALAAVIACGLSAGTAGAPIPSGGMDYPSIWACDQAKFNWYCDEEAISKRPPEQVEQAEKPKTPEEAALEELERLHRELDAKKALAVIDPTPENLRSYIVAQEALMSRASIFSDVWRRVIWQNPDLNYELKRPVNNAAIAAYEKTRKETRSQTLAEINQEWGVFFFFRSDCPYCHRMAPTMRYLTEQYGLSVLPISVDGGGLPDFPSPQQDNGLASMLNVDQVPYLVLGNVKEKRMVPLGSGVLSAEDVVERIYILTSTEAGDLY